MELMFILARIFGKTYIGEDFSEWGRVRVTMKLFLGEYYTIKEERIKWRM